LAANIFSLDYRLAPENKFPSSLQDANLALEWLGKELKIPISEISLCGDSAGGHLCASLSTYRAINKLELPLSQCLIYPMTDPLCNSKSQVDFDSGFFLSQKAMIWFWQQIYSLLITDWRLKINSLPHYKMRTLRLNGLEKN
jgi:acetyl esterase